MKRFFEIVRNDRIYILIDEYDSFANSILGESIETFRDILSKGGFVRGFYETIKTATLKVVATLKERFEFDKGFERDDFITLLYSLGFITIKDTFLTETEFTIPNYTIKTFVPI